MARLPFELKFRLEPGDTVLARAIGSRNHLGKCSYFDGYEEDVYIDSHVMRLRPNQEICNPIWFYSLMRSAQGKRLIQKAGGQTAVQFNINAKQASSIKLPLPEKSLQDRYEKIYLEIRKFWSTDSLHAEELEILFQALQQRAFSGEL
jgi:type I restriction enzyme S subunit